MHTNRRAYLKRHLIKIAAKVLSLSRMDRNVPSLVCLRFYTILLCDSESASLRSQIVIVERRYLHVTLRKEVKYSDTKEGKSIRVFFAHIIFIVFSLNCEIII